jgi:hypothetical protein
VALSDFARPSSLEISVVKAMQKCIYYFECICRNMSLEEHTETQIQVSVQRFPPFKNHIKVSFMTFFSNCRILRG